MSDYQTVTQAPVPTTCLRCWSLIPDGEDWCSRCHPATGVIVDAWQSWVWMCEADADEDAEHITRRVMTGLAIVANRIIGGWESRYLSYLKAMA